MDDFGQENVSQCSSVSNLFCLIWRFFIGDAEGEIKGEGVKRVINGINEGFGGLIESIMR